MRSVKSETSDSPIDAKDADNVPDNAEHVGYRHPPVRTRFKPGQSGNPRGRPKGSKSLDALARDLLSRKVAIQDGGVRRKVSLIEAVVLTSSQRALQGDNRAAKMILDLGRQVSEIAQAEDPTQVTTAQDQELINDFLARYRKVEV